MEQELKTINNEILINAKEIAKEKSTTVAKVKWQEKEKGKDQ